LSLIAVKYDSTQSSVCLHFETNPKAKSTNDVSKMYFFVIFLPSRSVPFTLHLILQ
jgi:hypothetical protein